MTANGTARACSQPDALRVLCVTGQKVCSAAQLARQCVAARVNQLITRRCGNENNCFAVSPAQRVTVFICRLPIARPRHSATAAIYALPVLLGSKRSPSPLIRSAPASLPFPQTANINGDRLNACCGETGPAPSGTALSSCITDVNLFNQDKSSLGTTCSASQLPQGGPGLTQKVCNDYSSAFSSATASQTCVQGFCATGTAWGRKLLGA
jgi:hypothetical protein